MRSSVLTCALFLTATLAGPAESRVWKSSDGTQSFAGEYVSHDASKVTIRRTDGRVFTLDVAKLNEADKSWLETKDAPPAVPQEKAAIDDPLPDPKAVFDTLCFGDSHEDVMKKLKESKIVEAGLDETYHGRVGLNGTYRTRKQIGGLHCDLYFDWTTDGNLTEISLRTQGLDKAAYPTQLKANWEELAELLTTLHGKPVQAGPFPSGDSLRNDLFLASHLWRLEGGGSATLGTLMQENRYLVVVRFTKERITPVRTP